MKIDCCESGSKPFSCMETAMPSAVWVCSTQPTSGRASWMALWMMKPAGLISNGDANSLLPCISTLTRLEAVISSNINP
ncbi:hypothetical protein D9M68_868650 [compost metagenome]